MLWPADTGPGGPAPYRDFMESAPDEVGGGLIYLTASAEMPFVPESLYDQLACGVLLTYLGDERGVRELARPLLDLDPWAR